MNWKHLTATIGLLAAASSVGAQTCDRSARESTLGTVPTGIKASTETYTEVIFPEALRGILPETTKGLVFEQNHLADRLFFQVKDADYNGLITLHGESGESYRIHVQGVESCPDSTVKLNTAKAVKESFVKPPKRGVRPLMEYMLAGKKPPSYALEYFKPEEQKLLLKQGSVHMYPYAIYNGFNYTGLVLRVVNAGRTPFKVALDEIDYSSPEIIEHFGHVKEISMLPADRLLAPQPEFAAEAYNTPHEGLIFIVSYKREGSY